MPSSSLLEPLCSSSCAAERFFTSVTTQYTKAKNIIAIPAISLILSHVLVFAQAAAGSLQKLTKPKMTSTTSTTTIEINTGTGKSPLFGRHRHRRIKKQRRYERLAATSQLSRW
eukprot:TRINITY_DN19185_c0_g2_i2.p2 TRINITY_DN19185_c0_g2~~TRINITY_DN19185_c0_g2_i2.p2  ORF type:complete len:114 (-),score=8.06 TRINITY_DN19185_c0_g2_i2:42-383(-)